MAGSIFQRATETSVAEGTTTIQVEFVRSGSTAGAVTIQYGVDSDSATPGQDYNASGGIVVMPDGAASVFVPIAILDDALGEETEVFTVSLISATGAELSAPRTNRISILDDETPAPPPPVEPPLVSPYTVATDTLVSGLSLPIRFAFSPAAPNVMYIAEKDGLVRVADLAAGSVGILLDLRAQTNNAGDRGLLDVAVHPDFANNPYIYVYHVVDPPDAAGNAGAAGRDGIGNRYAQIVRYTADAATGFRTLLPDSGVVLVGGGGQSLSDTSSAGTLDYTDPAHAGEIASDRVFDTADRVIGGFKQDYLKVDNRSHAGGRLLFGPDGKLYAFTGDGTSYNYADPRTRDVQSLDSLSGKVLRIDPITGQGLADNPFAAQAEDLDANRAKIFQYGLRNPFSGAFDDQGRLFIADVGWFAFEEINTAGPGANFGWPYFEGGDGGTLAQTPQYRDHPGAAEFYAAVAAGTTVITPAFRAFSHNSAAPGYQMQAIISSGMIGASGPYPASLAGRFVFSDFVGGNVFSIDPDNRLDTDFLMDWPGEYGPIHMQQAADGYIYYADLERGTVGRLRIADAPAADPAIVSISTQTISAAEGDDGSVAFTFSITRTGDMAGAFTVDWRAGGAIGVGTQPAEASDFVGGQAFPSGTLDFAPGQTEVTLQVLIAGDQLGEYNERFALTLENPSAGATIAQATAEATIINDDGGLAILSIGGLTRPEGSSGGGSGGGVTAFAIPVTRTGSVSEAVSAEWTVAAASGPGTVPAGTDDFAGSAFPSGIVSFAAGQTKAVISVLVAADALVELNERFGIALANASAGATISTASATAVILNDDSSLAIGPAMVTKAEGNSGSVAYSFTVSRAGTTGPITVNWAVAGDGGTPAEASDFVGGVLPSGTISFAAGQTSQAISVLVAGDTLHELDEVFTVTLSGAPPGTTIATATARGTITSEDAQINIAEAGSRLPEGSGGTTAFQFLVMRAGAPTLTQTIDWAVEGRTGPGTVPASAADFAGSVFPSGTVTFAPGESGHMVTVNIAADSLAELNERFAMVLSNPSPGATIGSGSAQGVIFNDDATLSIAPLAATRAEGSNGSTPFTFKVSRSGDTATTHSATWTVSGLAGANAAPAGAADFAGGALPSGTVTFAPGATAATITVAVAADTIGELNERFAVTLSAPSPGATIKTATAAGTIFDDDTTVSIGPAVRYLAEGNAGTTLATLTVHRGGVLSGTTAVDWTLAPGGRAGTLPVDAADFAGGVLPTGGTISFAPGETQRSLTFAIAGDSIVEPNESFTVTIAPPSGTGLGAASAAVAIIDDDTIHGSPAGETLTGTAGGDMFVIGQGHDTIIGGAGGDSFRFLPSAIGPAAQNSFTFNDFHPGSEWERLDLARIDANPQSGLDDAFSFIGTAPFSGTPGELRWQQESGFRLIQGNIDSNPAPDLTIIVVGTGPVTANWFVL